jgi:hypothetical protein
MYRHVIEWCQLALNPTKCGVKRYGDHSSRIFVHSTQNRTQPHAFLLEFVHFSIFRIYSVFLIIFFKTETFVDLVSHFPDANMATVLRIAQLTVKLKVTYVRDCKACIIFTVISVLTPYPNRPRKKMSLCKYVIL